MHDLYLQNKTLLLLDIFENFKNTLFLLDIFDNFKNMCLKIYDVDPKKLLSAPGLAWQVAFKKTKVKLALLTDIDMLLIIKKV